MKIFRWVMVIPSAYFAWYLILLLGMLFLNGIESLCPEEKIISGMCIADWWRLTEDITIIIFSGLSAAAVIIVSTFVAPSNKHIVAVLSYLIGATVAVWIAVSVSAWPELISALVCGGIVVAIILNYFLKSNMIEGEHR
jgi:hypothetical protein